MSVNFYTLTVSDVRRETEDCVSVALNIPPDLQDIFSYKAGQYITFKHTINNEELRRSYSVCSAPHEGELRVAIKQVYQGKFSTFINTSLKAGMQLQVMPPNGHFYPNASGKHYIGFASGSGITPIISIAKDILHNNSQSTFTLIYGNKNVSSIIFKEQLEALKNTYMHRLRLINILSREHQEVPMNNGRIDEDKCQQLFDKVIDIKLISEAFICGPEDMTLAVKDYLIKNGMNSKQVKFELFGTGAGTIKKVVEKEQQPTGPISKVSIKVDDRTFVIDLAYDGDNILDAALKNGADLPFACKGGVCCTCRAKVVEGKVDMLVNYALEPEEVEAGFVLSCQAHPRTEKVVIDFDAR
jgi:ring-1,2-phenylacetyl-CoA epoxidase subunit PaaE